MRKNILSKRDIEIGNRLRDARDRLEITHEFCAKQIGIPRRTLINYELGKTPLNVTVALRFCRRFIINEEWLATGEFRATIKAALQWGIKPAAGWAAMEPIHFRLSMDLLSLPIYQRIKPGMPFSEAYDGHLKVHFEKLVCAHYLQTRVALTEDDPLEMAQTLVSSFLGRWLLMLRKKAWLEHLSEGHIQKTFTEGLLNDGNDLFFNLMKIKRPDSPSPIWKGIEGLPKPIVLPKAK